MIKSSMHTSGCDRHSCTHPSNPRATTTIIPGTHPLVPGRGDAKHLPQGLLEVGDVVATVRAALEPTRVRQCRAHVRALRECRQYQRRLGPRPRDALDDDTVHTRLDRILRRSWWACNRVTYGYCRHTACTSRTRCHQVHTCGCNPVK